jgi:hypothetical protein
LKAIKYPNQGYRISKDRDRFNKVEVILADGFINNNSNLDPTFYIILDNIDSLITSIKVTERKFYMDKT